MPGKGGQHGGDPTVTTPPPAAPRGAWGPQYGTFTADATTAPSASTAGRHRRRRSLHAEATPVSRLFFLWFEYLVELRGSRRVTAEDVWGLDDEDRSAAAYAAYMRHYTGPPSLLGAVWRCHRRPIVLSAGLSLLAAVQTLVGPVLMYLVISAAMAPSTPVSVIVGLLVAHHCSKVLGELAREHSVQLMATVSIRAVGAIQTLLFETALRATGARDRSVAETSNLFYEIETLQHMIATSHALWVAPVSLVANLAVLYFILGRAVLGGIAGSAILQGVAYLLRRLHRRIADRLMEFQGAQLQIMSECFKTIQSIKLNAWESRFLAKIRHVREQERRTSHVLMGVDFPLRAIILVLPELVVACVFAVLARTDRDPFDRASFNPATAFASLAVVYRAKTHFGVMVSSFFMAAVTATAETKLKEFLANGPDISTIGQSPPPHSPDGVMIRISNATIGRVSCEPTIIFANLEIPRGALVVIYGSIGSGKTTLLSSIVNPSLVVNNRGAVEVNGSVAYCSQTPWLQTRSIRENILFGSPFDEGKYLNVLHACCLLKDLKALPFGDKTVIGPKGLNLSGGQMARVCLARACYADADVYLLDSPLAHVDPIVQSDIFRRCVVRLLKHKTVVLTTHNTEIVYSPYVDQIVRLEGHRLVHESSQLVAAEFLSNRCQLTLPTRNRLHDDTERSSISSRHAEQNSCLQLFQLSGTRFEKDWNHVESKPHECIPSSPHPALLSKETIVQYFRTCGGLYGFFLPLLLFCGLSKLALIASHLWICSWSTEQRSQSDDVFHLMVFLACVVICACLSCVSWVICYLGCSHASDTIFFSMVRGVLFAPMSFFYHQPIGEIMNRFSVDVRALDERVVFLVAKNISAIVGVGLPLLVLVILLPEMLLVVPIAVHFVRRNRNHLSMALEMMRLLVASYTPCFESIAEAVDGRDVIQAFGSDQVERFRQEHHRRLDENLRMLHADGVMASWGNLQCLKLDTVLLIVVVVAVVVRRSTLHPAVLGLALNYVLIINYNLYFWCRSALELASELIKIQRGREYGQIVPEAFEDDRRASENVASGWPSNGEIKFERVCFRYEASGALVLHDVSLCIHPGEKIGLVGRTGAGKSSLTLALFRIHELASGRILIDNQDIATVALHTLRSRLSIVPQAPLFFKGSLRSYLDPFDEVDDAALWATLHKTGLGDIVTRLEGKLDAELHENADNISQGQRQLLCLSRVLLKRSKIVVMDEATSAIDQKADDVLQRVLQREFADITVISIAHRLESILECNRVVVMEDGRIVQCGRVEELVGDPNGVFFDLLEGSLLKI